MHFWWWPSPDLFTPSCKVWSLGSWFKSLFGTHMYSWVLSCLENIKHNILQWVICHCYCNWVISLSVCVVSWSGQQGRLGIWSWSRPTCDDTVYNTRYSTFVEWRWKVPWSVCVWQSWHTSDFQGNSIDCFCVCYCYWMLQCFDTVGYTWGADTESVKQKMTWVSCSALTL